MTSLETERLSLRRLRPSDARFLVELLNDPSFVRNIGDRGVRTRDDARRYLESGPLASYRTHGFGLYGVELRAGSEPLGICGLVRRPALHDVDLGFAFLPRHWGRGYAVEAAARVRDHAFEDVGLDRLVAITRPENRGSIRVLERIGMTFERMVRLADGEPELRLYALTRP